MVCNSPHGIHLLLARRLSPAHKQMPPPLLTPPDLQELVKLQHPLLAARPALAALVEHRLPRMVHAGLGVASRAGPLVGGIAASPPTGRVHGDLEGVVVRELGFVLGGRGGGRVGWRGKGGRVDGLHAAVWDGGGDGSRGLLVFGRCGGLGFIVGGWRRGIVDGGVFGGRAGWDGEEFFEGEHARFAAFPAWEINQSVQSVALRSNENIACVIATPGLVKANTKVLPSLTLLTLVEHRRPRMINAGLLGVGELLPAAFVHTLGRHRGIRQSIRANNDAGQGQDMTVSINAKTGGEWAKSKTKAQKYCRRGAPIRLSRGARRFHLRWSFGRLLSIWSLTVYCLLFSCSLYTVSFSTQYCSIHQPRCKCFPPFVSPRPPASPSSPAPAAASATPPNTP